MLFSKRIIPPHPGGALGSGLRRPALKSCQELTYPAGSPAMASLRAVRPPRPSTADGRSDRVPFGGGGVASSAGVAEHVARAGLRPTAGLEGRRGPTRRRLQGADENSQRQPGTATASPSTPRLNPAPSESHRGRRLRQGGRRHCGPVKENRSGSLCGVHSRPSSAPAPPLPEAPGVWGGRLPPSPPRPLLKVRHVGF